MPISITFLALCVLVLSTSVTAQLKNVKKGQIPKNAPIKIKVENYNRPRWWQDISIKVTNTGNKPIRYLYLILYLDIKDRRDVNNGFTFKFGNRNLYSSEAVSVPGDPEKPAGESIVLVVDDATAKAWDLASSQESFVHPTTASLSLGWLSFGDGTGIKSGGKPFAKRSAVDLFND